MMKAIPAAAVLACCFVLGVPAEAQTGSRPTPVKALMTSDIHFDPFWDPAKVANLNAAPVADWEAILAAPDSADRAQRFAALQTQCRTRGEDTSFPLLRSSLAAMKAQAAGVKFVTVSGDLIAHAFDCKFEAAVPGAKPGDYASFVTRTIAFVDAQLRQALPGVEMFEALGNNDSDCGDYELNVGGQFLGDTGAFMTADLPEADRSTAASIFQSEGDYSVPLPAPIHRARLLVLDDLFESVRYKTCSGKTDPAPGEAQIAWLRGQLETARSRHEKVWVMGHIPPGVDPYSTIRNLAKVCAGSSPTMFLSSDALGATLAAYGDVVELAIFAHTHMDELRLLTPSADAAGVKPLPPVALKMVPSISPVDGNNPSFMVAEIDPSTDALKDYKVIAASNQTGIGTSWTEEYDFSKAYGQPAFDARSLSALVNGFSVDRGAQTAASAEYLKNYFVRDASLGLKTFWPQYVCALENRTADQYRACACTAGK
jgi:sphingomyelin phosphodiesterase acid-like 3